MPLPKDPFETVFSSNTSAVPAAPLERYVFVTRLHRIKEAFCREVVLRDVFFGKFTLSISRYVKLLARPTGLIFLVLCGAMLFAGDPNDVRAIHGAPFAVFIWTTSLLAYTSVVFLIIGLLAMLQSALPRLPLYTPITSALGLLAVFIFARGLIVLFTGMENREGVFPLYFNVLVTGLTLETLFIRFVLQNAGHDTEGEEDEAPRLLNIGDRSLPLSRVHYLHAQEHYIRIGLPNDTIMIRGRMRDALAQVDETDGFQPHRSWWISAAAQPRLIQANGKQQVRLRDETEVPVAKARAADIQRWLDHNKDW